LSDASNDLDESLFGISFRI